MNWQPLPLPARKRLLQAESPARLKLFCSFKTPDSKASAKSPNEFCVRRALIQRRKERAKRRYPPQAERINGSGVRWRAVFENTCLEKWRLDPVPTESRNLLKL